MATDRGRTRATETAPGLRGDTARGTATGAAGEEGPPASRPGAIADPDADAAPLVQAATNVGTLDEVVVDVEDVEVGAAVVLGAGTTVVVGAATTVVVGAVASQMVVDEVAPGRPPGTGRFTTVDVVVVVVEVVEEVVDVVLDEDVDTVVVVVGAVVVDVVVLAGAKVVDVVVVVVAALVAMADETPRVATVIVTPATATPSNPARTTPTCPQVPKWLWRQPDLAGRRARSPGCPPVATGVHAAPLGGVVHGQDGVAVLLLTDPRLGRPGLGL